MTALEKSELIAIFGVALSVYWFSFLLPATTSLGEGVVWLAGTTFVQSLIRDLILISQKRKEQKNQAHTQSNHQHCVCLESIVGLSVLLVGALLLFATSPLEIALNQRVWTSAAVVVLLFGFLIKDLVVTWKPVAIRRDKDHMNIIVKW